MERERGGHRRRKTRVGKSGYLRERRERGRGERRRQINTQTETEACSGKRGKKRKGKIERST